MLIVARFLVINRCANVCPHNDFAFVMIALCGANNPNKRC